MTATSPPERWWTDPEHTGLHRLPARADLTSYPDSQAAQTGRSPWERSLDGSWRFLLVGRPAAAPEGWEQADHDDTDWRGVDVPGCWTRQDVGDLPHYTNVVMPFEGDPPAVPELNPTGLHRVRFDRPRGWAKRRTIVRIGGAESAAAVWCNGAFVGTMTDSRLPSEFDLTPHLRGRDNVLAVMVIRWAATTWVEDQDHWHHGGLHRSVTLRSVGPVSLQDVRVRAELGDDLRSGVVDVEARVDGAASGWTVEAAAFRTPTARRAGASGAAAVSAFDASNHFAAMIDAYRHPGPLARIRLALDDVRPWSHEDPHLGRADVRLVDPEGTVHEVVTVPVGFRRVEIRDRELLLNGVAVPIAGVNRHDHHPVTGKTVTPDEQRAEVAAIKAAGFNALRTAHYPPDRPLLDACDELGLWVICEANVESHARWEQLVHEPAYQRAYVERPQRMALVHGNHPSVFAWSLGNEAGYGPAHDAAAAWLRHHDRTRIVHYEGAIMRTWVDDLDAAQATVATDLVCPMYPTVDDLVRWASTTSGTKPLVMCEYSHAMGNSNGGLAEYWEAIDGHHGLQGGFIWDWRDQGLDEVDTEGRHLWAYGGHFGEHPHDADFCCNGIVGPDGTPRPALEEHRWLTRPVVTSWLDDRQTTLAVTNRRSFSDLSDLRAELILLVDGEPAERLLVDAPDLGPGATGRLRVPAALRRIGPGERSLLVTWRRRRRPSWDAGAAPAWDQLPLVGEPVVPAPPEPAVVERTGSMARVGRLVVGIDTDRGGLGSLIVSGRELLVEPVRLSLWRAPTDNDGPSVGPGAGVGGVRPRWLALGLDRLEPELLDLRGRRSGEEVSFTSSWRWTAGELLVEHRQRVTVAPEGLVRIDEDVRVPDHVDDLPRVSVRFAVTADLDRLEWFGAGPHETYPDRRSGAVVRRWSSSVEDRYVPYVVPQHHGTLTDVRWFRLRDGRGRGLEFGLAGASFDASHLPVEHLTAATTVAELRPTPEVHVHLDAAIRGVGTAACGPDVSPAHLVRGGRHRWSWTVRSIS
ncbi:MAG: glycoside hydrolase family 2 TIM barrel-domain containing protein [Actinomycetota bacterium]